MPIEAIEVFWQTNLINNQLGSEICAMNSPSQDQYSEHGLRPIYLQNLIAATLHLQSRHNVPWTRRQSSS